MPKPIEHHNIIVVETSADQRDTYGVTHKSLYVYNTTKLRFAPTRLNVWNNTNRPNPFKGMKEGDVAFEGNPHRQQVITKYFINRPGRANPLTAKYLDPHNEPTDDAVTLLLSPEASCITSNGTNTGTAASGQVFDKGVTLGDGDTATLRYLDGTSQEITIHFTGLNTGNGHGFATFNS